ncbi:PH domain-containing protein [Slackia piriformis]
MEAATNWTFFQECQPTQDIMQMLTPGEQCYAAFKTIRDIAAFTNKRLIVRDSQGLTGKKVEIYSLPWKSVDMWSSENAGHFDLDAEIELWTRAGHIKVSLRKGADVRRIESLIANFVLA